MDAMKDLMLTSSNVNYVHQELLKLDLSKPKRISISDWKKKRSISANNQQHLWYAQIDKQSNNIDGYTKRFCKYTFGLPLLLNSEKHADFYETLLDALRFYSRTYEERIELMEGIEVTSKFNTSESKQYMEQMIFYFNDAGIPIKFKDDI
jgi:hypothetical protein